MTIKHDTVEFFEAVTFAYEALLEDAMRSWHKHTGGWSILKRSYADPSWTTLSELARMFPMRAAPTLLRAMSEKHDWMLAPLLSELTKASPHLAAYAVEDGFTKVDTERVVRSWLEWADRQQIAWRRS